MVKVLSGRKVVLYPDLNSWEEWKGRAEKLMSICEKVVVSRLIQDKATPKEIGKGLDVADCFVLNLQLNEYNCFCANDQDKLTGIGALISISTGV